MFHSCQSKLTLAACLVALWCGLVDLPAQPVVIESPVAQGGAFFGDAMATLDGRRLIVGASGIDEGPNDDVGRVFLFGPTGGLLATITNPIPTPYAYFGMAVAGMTSNRIIVGAPESDVGDFIIVGRAHLFGTNGNWLAAFNDPAPADSNYFGAAVAAVGDQWVLVGAPGVSEGSKDAVGRAYLFRTNGTLARTITNPVPNTGANFGQSVAALDRDRFLVGAFQQSRSNAAFGGEVYLFHTNGNRLATLTNPVPEDFAAFGFSLAPLGTDRVVVGAYGAARAGFVDSGVAYLLRTNGALLAVLTNPLPADYASFGGSLSVVDQDKILVGADGATRAGASSTGEAYLFSTNGTLLTTITNPANGVLDLFGWASAPVGSNVMAISANQYSQVSNSFVGRTYLFPLPPLPGPEVRLSITGTDASRTLSWLTIPHRILQETTNLTPPVVWTDSALTVITNGVTNFVTLPLQGDPPFRAFRLRTP
jgi:hypothetical protein